MPVNQATILTKRQHELLNLVCEGYTDKEIAVRLGLSGGTVKTYWDRLRRRYNAKSRSEVIAKSQLDRSRDEFSRFMVDKLPFYIWSTDAQGKLTFCNEWFRELVNDSEDELMGRGYGEVLGLPSIVDGHQAYSRRANGTCFELLAELPSHVEMRSRHKVAMIPVESPPGRIHHWIGYARELAENADARMIDLLKTMVG